MTPTSATRRTTLWQAGPGRPTWGIVVGDLLRLAALLSVLIAVVWTDWTAVALFLFVLGATMIPRAMETRAALDTTYCGSLVVAAWLAQLETYRDVPGLDLVVHAVTTGAIAVLAHQVLARYDVVVPARRSGSSTVVTVVGLGALVATVWELLEAAGHTLVDDSIYVTYLDTIGDLVAGLLGSAVAALLAVRAARRAPAGIEVHER